MQSQRNKMRPLGSMRQSATKLERSTHFPPLGDGIYQDSNKLDRHYSGIHGCAMTVPPAYVKTSQSPQKEYLEERRKSSSKSTQSEAIAVKSPDPALKKELRESLAREKDLKQQIEDLLNTIERLNAEINVKNISIRELEEQIKKMETDMKKSISEEIEKHKTTKVSLEASNTTISQLQKEITDMKADHDSLMAKMQKEFEDKLSTTISEKDKEIKIRDDKLDKLKQQMADALKGNSWERQQQLEELTKELGKIQDEADMLRMKIRTLAKNKEGSCSHCEESNNKLQRALQGIKERDGSIKELKSLAIRFETQLSKQDQLLKIWADEKGHKLPKFPK